MQAKTSLIKIKINGETRYVYGGDGSVQRRTYEQKFKDLVRREKAAQKMFPEMSRSAYLRNLLSEIA